jgi:ribonuclease T1
MRNRLFPLLVIIAVIGWFYYQHTPPGQVTTAPTANSQSSAATGQAPASCPAMPSFLPAEASQTLSLIGSGGPFEHSQDGTVFGNREGLLPSQSRGYYHEYTVETPGSGNRGARRIITGGSPPTVYYYTDDHYGSFRTFRCLG